MCDGRASDSLPRSRYVKFHPTNFRCILMTACGASRADCYRVVTWRRYSRGVMGKSRRSEHGEHWKSVPVLPST